MRFPARRIAEGLGRTEGPVIRQTGEIVVTSMDQGRVFEIKDGETRLLADVGHLANGAAESSDGTIYVAQAGATRWGPNAGVGGVQTVSTDGTIGWLTQDPIAPNDLCFGPDGLLYLTDPTRSRPARDDGRLFRCNIATGETELLCTVPWFPNGIGFGNDDALYVASYEEQRIVRYSFDGGRLGKPETFLRMETGRPDGFLFDLDGNIVIGANSETDEPGSVQTFDQNGRMLDIFFPGPGKFYTNVALAADRVLIITDASGGAVLAVDDWPTAGLPLYPFRKKR